jgi:hypothetical protein
VNKGPFGLWQIFRWPLLLGLASAVGLLAALVGDGAWDVLSWVLLAAPVVLCLRGLRRRSPPL